MSLRISNVCLSIDEPEEALRPRLTYLLGLDASATLHYRILRKALDARDPHALQFVYTAEVRPADEPELNRFLARKMPRQVRIERFEEEPFVLPPAGTLPLPHRPVV